MEWYPNARAFGSYDVRVATRPDRWMRCHSALLSAAPPSTALEAAKRKALFDPAPDCDEDMAAANRYITGKRSFLQTVIP